MRILDRIKKLWKDRAGVTLVEVVCAVGIMGLVGFSVAAMVVSSSNSYARGTTEVNLQQESQFAANLMGSLVMDAVGDIEYAESGSDVTMKVQKVDAIYEIKYVNADSCIYCSMYDTAGAPIAEDQYLAENVAVFRADPSDFATTGNLKMYLDLENGERSYAADYTMTSRNGLIHTSTMESAVSIITENRIVVEPSQQINLQASVVGTTMTDLNWVLSGNTSSDTMVYLDVDGTWKLKVAREERSAAMTLFAQTVAKKEDGVTPIGQTTVTVLVRRVTGVTLTSHLDSGSNMRNGAVYTITASVAGTNLDITSLESDQDHPDRNYKQYMATRNINWNLVYTVDGQPVNNAGNSYYQVISSNSTEGGGTCYFKVKLTRDMTDTAQVMLTATATHPEGMINTIPTNKTADNYDHVYSYWWLVRNYYSYNGAALQRSSDDSLGSFDSYGALKNMLASRDYGGWGYTPFEPRKYHRYRMVLSEDEDGNRTYGPWTKWRLNPQNTGDMDINLRPLVLSFDFNKAYEVQVCLTVFDTHTNQTAWPIKNVTPGNGDYIATDIPTEAYIMDGIVRPVEVRYQRNWWDDMTGFGNQWGWGIDIVLNHQEEQDSIRYLTHSGYKANELGNYLTYTMQYKDGNEWKTIDNSTKYKAEVVQQGVQGTFKFRQPGDYRVLVGCSNISAYEWNGSTYVQTPNRSYPLYNTDTGVGVFYYYVKKPEQQ